jgi:hypothetical protein
MTLQLYSRAADVLAESITADVEQCEQRLRYAMVDCVWQLIPFAEDYVELISSVLTSFRQTDNAYLSAKEVFQRYLVSQFYDRLILAVEPSAAVRLSRPLIDIAELERLPKSGAIVASLHQSRYLLFGSRFFVERPEFYKMAARPTSIDHAGFEGRVAKRTLHASDRSTPVKAVRALSAGATILMMIDHVHSHAEKYKLRFLGAEMEVNLGAAWLALKAGVPIFPIALFQDGPIYRLRVLPAVYPTADLGATMQNICLQLEQAVALDPLSWNRWGAVFGDQRKGRIQQELRAIKQTIWQEIIRAYRRREGAR